MNPQVKLVVMVIASVLTLTWIILANGYEKRFRTIVSTVDSKQFHLSSVMQVGFRILELMRFDIHSERSQAKIKVMAEVYGARYAGYYYYVLTAAQITDVLTILPVALVLGVLSDSGVILLVMIAMAFIAAWYLNEAFKDKLEARQNALRREFPQVLSKLTLLVNSGMMLREAWKKISDDKEGTLYEEMRQTTVEMANGVPEAQCYQHFAERCGMKEMRKFASLVNQSLAKGGSELPHFLQDMSREMWDARKADVRQEAEKANARLLIPTVLIFLGILVMVIVPIMTGL